MPEGDDEEHAGRRWLALLKRSKLALFFRSVSKNSLSAWTGDISLKDGKSDALYARTSRG